LLRVLESQQRVGFRDIVTNDESWFLQHYDHRQIWCIWADDVPTGVTHTIDAQKTMVTVLLSIDGAILINWLTPWGIFNSGYFCEKVLEPFSETLHGGRAAGSPRPIVHFDNTTPHQSAAIELTFNIANSDMLPSHPTARISIRVISFYSAT
jgi:hypothetical protein